MEQLFFEDKIKDFRVKEVSEAFFLLSDKLALDRFEYILDEELNEMQ